MPNCSEKIYTLIIPFQKTAASIKKAVRELNIHNLVVHKPSAKSKHPLIPSIKNKTEQTADARKTSNNASASAHLFSFLLNRRLLVSSGLIFTRINADIISCLLYTSPVVISSVWMKQLSKRLLMKKTNIHT